MSHKTVVKLINYDQKFLDFLDFFLQENSLFFSFLTRNQKPRKMPFVVVSYVMNVCIRDCIFKKFNTRRYSRKLRKEGDFLIECFEAGDHLW